ncbi:hypothetical protein BpHYR1_032342 [Brachionus plicatilis]|uniref:Uncharacterized protein n=1 Tax=Brachionus plicatilis TaxID=10195 RepID=A0A3M7Q518_BRAPC|nr:hypothetical protein BpHYR1_032342 [Brachionus plicatilis]
MLQDSSFGIFYIFLCFLDQNSLCPDIIQARLNKNHKLTFYHKLRFAAIEFFLMAVSIKIFNIAFLRFGKIELDQILSLNTKYEYFCTNESLKKKLYYFPLSLFELTNFYNKIFKLNTMRLLSKI